MPLPSLDDSDDIIHLDVQLIWLLKVLKGPHVGRLSLGAETDHCPVQAKRPMLPLALPSHCGQICPHLQQEVPKGHKSGSVLWFVGPALDHDIVDVLGTVLRPGQALPFLVDLMQDLPGRRVHMSGAAGLSSPHHLPFPDLTHS